MLVAIRALLLLFVAVAHTEKARNEKVRVVEGAIQPGETEALHSHPASGAVYLQGGDLEVTPYERKPQPAAPKRGDVVFRERYRP